MRKLIVKMSITLDGFVCGPNGEMDWFMKTRSDDGAAWTAEKIAQAGAHLLGRKTFTEMSAYWPSATGVFAKPMNEIPKIAFTRNGFQPSNVNASSASARSWAEAKIISGDLANEIMKLKQEEGKPLIAQGGASFVQSLVLTGLVDEFWLLRHPIAIGQGRGLFDKLAAPLQLKLIETKTFSIGSTANVYLADR